jgi:hypothetical protein
MQVQPCRSAWHLCGCLKLCKHVRFCTPLGFSWIFMVAKSRTSRSFRDIVACLELSVHWVPSVLICFDCFALDFEVEAMWFFQLDYMNGWLLNLLMCIDIGLQTSSKYCFWLHSDLMILMWIWHFFAKVVTIETLSRDTWGARCASIMTSGFWRILLRI